MAKKAAHTLIRLTFFIRNEQIKCIHTKKIFYISHQWTWITVRDKMEYYSIEEEWFRCGEGARKRTRVGPSRKTETHNVKRESLLLLLIFFLLVFRVLFNDYGMRHVSTKWNVNCRGIWAIDNKAHNHGWGAPRRAKKMYANGQAQPFSWEGDRYYMLCLHNMCVPQFCVW